MHTPPAMRPCFPVSRPLFPCIWTAVALALAIAIGGCEEEQPPPPGTSGVGGTGGGAFGGTGQRRTQNLQGGIAGTAPFHWDGDMPDLGHLMAEVFTSRMGGPGVPQDHVKVLGTWLDRLPAPAAAPGGDAAAIERGRALFNDPLVACAVCHSGPRFSNNQTVPVGTGQPFQVPSLLGVGLRAPYMHDGCAPTLKRRFSSLKSCNRRGHARQDQPADAAAGGRPDRLSGEPLTGQASSGAMTPGLPKSPTFMTVLAPMTWQRVCSIWL